MKDQDEYENADQGVPTLPRYKGNQKQTVMKLQKQIDVL
jgi:hypothetical protein